MRKNYEKATLEAARHERAAPTPQVYTFFALNTFPRLPVLLDEWMDDLEQAMNDDENAWVLRETCQTFLRQLFSQKDFSQIFTKKRGWRYLNLSQIFNFWSISDIRMFDH